MLDLSRIDLATEEDKQYQLDHWAALFKAKTWEELQMPAQKHEIATLKADLADANEQISKYQQHIQALEAQLAEYQLKENSSDK